jgi:hypothetical protein
MACIPPTNALTVTRATTPPPEKYTVYTPAKYGTKQFARAHPSPPVTPVVEYSVMFGAVPPEW